MIKNLKKSLAVAMALTMTVGFAACSSDSNSGDADATTTTETTTTTAATVAINEKELDNEQVEALGNAMSKLQDVELENKEIKWLAKKYPVIDLASGCSTDISNYLMDSADVGIRAAFHGTDWATNRESIADAIEMLVNEVDTNLQNKVAEFN